MKIQNQGWKIRRRRNVNFKYQDIDDYTSPSKFQKNNKIKKLYTIRVREYIYIYIWVSSIYIITYNIVLIIFTRCKLHHWVLFGATKDDGVCLQVSSSNTLQICNDTLYWIVITIMFINIRTHMCRSSSYYYYYYYIMR